MKSSLLILLDTKDSQRGHKSPILRTQLGVYQEEAKKENEKIMASLATAEVSDGKPYVHVTKHPEGEVYQAGGRMNGNVFWHVELRDAAMFGKSSAPHASVNLQYEDGKVLNDDILQVSSPSPVRRGAHVYQFQPLSGTDNFALELRFRIRDLSHAHDGRRFRLGLTVSNVAAHGIDIPPIYSNPITVKAKAKKKKKRAASEIAWESGTSKRTRQGVDILSELIEDVANLEDEIRKHIQAFKGHINIYDELLSKYKA